MSIFGASIGNNKPKKVKPEEVSLYGQRVNIDPKTYNPALMQAWAPWAARAGATAGAAADQLTAAGADNQLYGELSNAASGELALGGSLSPDEIRAANQAGLASWSSRGLTRSPQAGFAAVLARMQYANQRKADRQGFAMGVANLGLQRQQAATSALGTSAQAAAIPLALAEDTRQTEVARDDTLRFNDKRIAADLKIGEQNAKAGQSAAKTSAFGSIIGGLFGAL